MQKAPIAFFVYNRPQHALNGLESLAACKEAGESELFIFCDGAKRPEDEEKVRKVRRIVGSRQWCGKVEIIEQAKNIGLANSIITGTTRLCKKFGKVIVIEDDLILSPFFLTYMNDALNLYEQEESVMQISGYMIPVELFAKSDTLFLPFSYPLGWGTWAGAWSCFDPDANGYEKLKQNRDLQYRFNLDNSYPFYETLKAQIEGKVDSWYIRWYLSIFFKRGIVLYPKETLVIHAGYDGSGTHAHINPFKQDDHLSGTKISVEYKKPEIDIELYAIIKKSFKKHYYSLPVRIKSFIIETLKIFGLVRL